MMNDHIRHDHEDLLDSLVGGKLPRNLTWSAVVDLIAQIGEVQPHGHDEFFFVVGAKRELFKRPSSHDLDVEAPFVPTQSARFKTWNRRHLNAVNEWIIIKSNSHGKISPGFSISGS